MREDNDLKEREQEEREESLPEVVPPEDIIAFNELRSCADLFRLFDKQQLDIAPNFQRKVVWSNKEQTLFVDSLMKQLPIPSLCIGLDAKSQKRVVIDGLQRMYTIIRFLNFAKEDWRLANCKDVDGKIAGKYVSEINTSSPELFSCLENLTIPVTVLRYDCLKASHMWYLFQIFRRLNSGGRRLLNQEIRNCIYCGRLNDFLREYVRCSAWQDSMRCSLHQIDNSRYGHEERVLRFLAMASGWQRYTGNLAEFLNNFMGTKRDMSAVEISKWRCRLDAVLKHLRRMNVPKKILQNKNLIEGVMVGLDVDSLIVDKLSDEELRTRFNELMQTPAYSINIKEGMAHTDKVKGRIEGAIQILGGR